MMTNGFALPGEPAAALLKRCCTMCAPGHTHVCDIEPAPAYDRIDNPEEMPVRGPLADTVQAALDRVAERPVTATTASVGCSTVPRAMPPCWN